MEWCLHLSGIHSFFSIHNAFSLLRKQRLDYPKNVIFGHLNINSLRNKFESISELIKGKFDIFLINETKLDASFPSNQFAMSGYKFVRKDRNKFGGGIAFYINDIAKPDHKN